MIKRMSQLAPAFIALLMAATLAGCLKDKLKLNADGSGTWEYRLILGPRLTAMMDDMKKKMENSNGQLTIKPSPGKDIMFEEKTLRKAIANIKGAKLIKFDREKKNDQIYIHGKIQFDSIAAMINSPLGEKIDWSFSKENGNLRVYSDKLFDMSSSGNTGGDQMQFNMFKAMFMGLEVERIITLPNKVVKSNAEKTKGDSVQWSFKLSPNTTEKQFKAFDKTKPFAVCSGKGVTFKLPLKPKKSVADTPSFEKVDAVNEPTAEAKELTTAADNVMVTRSIYYDRENNNMVLNPNGLNLNLRVSWPNQFKPIGYKSILIEQASDDQGTNLTPKNMMRCTNLMRFNIMPNKPNQSVIHTNLATPAKTANAFNVKGNIIVTAPAGVTKCEIKNIQQFIGKKLDVPELKDLDVTLKKCDANNVQLESPNNLEKVLEMRFVNGDQDVKAWSVNNMRWGNTFRSMANFNKKVENPTLIIILAKEMKDYKVPFDFKDLKLP